MKELSRERVAGVILIILLVVVYLVATATEKSVDTAACYAEHGRDIGDDGPPIPACHP